MDKTDTSWVPEPWTLPHLRDRASRGAYYTPQALSTAITRWAIRTPSDRVLEPSFGGCEFLQCSVERLAELGALSPWAQIVGYDISAHAEKILRERCPEAIGTSALERRDFLSVSPGSTRVDAVLANPPYIGHHRFTKKQRATATRAAQAYGEVVSSTAKLLAHFLLHSLRFLSNGGRI